MIPAVTPYEVRYQREETRPDGTKNVWWNSTPVVAWSDKGFPLVAGKRGLVLAELLGEYELYESSGPVVATIPGGGWRAEYKNEDNSVDSNPVIAWVVYADGSCHPFDSTGDGYAESVNEVSNLVRVFHPEEAPAA